MTPKPILNPTMNSTIAELKETVSRSHSGNVEVSELLRQIESLASNIETKMASAGGPTFAMSPANAQAAQLF